MVDLRPPWCCAGMVRESERIGTAMSEASQPLNALPQGIGCKSACWALAALA